MLLHIPKQFNICVVTEICSDAKTLLVQDYLLSLEGIQSYSNKRARARETYLRAQILSSFGHARSRAQPLAWLVGEGGGGGGGG